MAEFIAAAKAVLATVAFEVAGVTVTVGNIITAAYVVGSAVDGRRRARHMAADARRASMQDRSVMVRSATAYRTVTYGRDRVSGAIADMFTTGDREQYLHILVAIAGHEIDAVEAVYLNDVELPAPDVDGFIQSGSFVRTRVTAGAQTSLTSSGGGVVTLSQSVTRVTSVVHEPPGDTGPTVLGGWSHTGGTATISGLPASTANLTVNYEVDTVEPRVRVHSFLGAPGQTVPPALLAETGGRRTSSHTGEGLAWLWVRLQWDNEVFGQVGLPNISARIRGKKVRDPRTGLTAWSANAALCTGDFLRDAAHGVGCTAAQLPDAELIASANIADEAVTIYATGTVALTNGSPNVTGTGTVWTQYAHPGGLFHDGTNTYTIASVTDDTHIVLATNWAGTTGSGLAYSLRQRRYEANGTLSDEEGRLANLDRLVEAMAGQAVWAQGRWLVRAGAHPTPEAWTLTEDHLAGNSVQVRRRPSRRELFNAVGGTYLEPRAGYVEVSFPSVENATYVTQDGGRRVQRDLQLELVNNAIAAQRLAKIALERARQAVTLTIDTSLRAYNLLPGDVVPVTLARYGWTGKLFEVRRREWNPQTGQLRYVLRETASSVWSWSMGDATAVDDAPDTSLPSPFAAPTALAGLTAASGDSHLLALGDGTQVVRALLSWTATTDHFVLQGGRIEVQWKRANATAWIDAPPAPGSGSSAYIGPLGAGTAIVARVRPVNAAGRAGAWTTVAHAVTGKDLPPNNVSGLTATQVPGEVRIEWTPPTDLDYSHTVLRRGASWAAGVPLYGTDPTQTKASRFSWPWPSAGSYTVWAKHVDHSGNESSTAASAAVTVDAGILITDKVIDDLSTTVGSTTAPGSSVRAGFWEGPAITTDAEHQLDFSILGKHRETFYSAPVTAEIECWLVWAATSLGAETEITNTRRKWFASLGDVSGTSHFQIDMHEKCYVPGAVTRYYKVKYTITFRDSSGNAVQCGKDFEAEASWRVVRRRR